MSAEGDEAGRRADPVPRSKWPGLNSDAGSDTMWGHWTELEDLVVKPLLKDLDRYSEWDDGAPVMVNSRAGSITERNLGGGDNWPAGKEFTRVLRDAVLGRDGGPGIDDIYASFVEKYDDVIVAIRQAAQNGRAAEAAIKRGIDGKGRVT